MMSDKVLWGLALTLPGLLAVATATLLLDGFYQVVTGRMGFLPFERMLRKRRPANELNSVRQGASKILQAIGLIFIAGPSSLMLIVTTAELNGITVPALSRVPAVIDVALISSYFASLLLGLVCVIGAYTIGTRVSYVPTDSKVPTRS
jgi:hypothetical protein